MKTESPPILNNDFNRLVQDMETLIPQVFPAWKPKEGDPGSALVKIYAHMAKEVIDRLNRVPQKHFEAFLDMVGMKLLPAAPARVPITFLLSENAGHVPVPKGTPLTSPDNFVFETETNILASPASITAAFTTHPETDGIFSLPTLLFNPKNQVQPSFTQGLPLFQGQDLQTHALFIAHTHLLQVQNPVNFEISGLDGPFETLAWQYWGIRKENGETPGWIAFDSISRQGEKIILEKSNTDTIEELEINAVKSRWIRCITPPFTPAFSTAEIQNWSFTPSGITLSKPPPPPRQTGAIPDVVYCNENPADLGSQDNPNPLYPFGTRPQQGNIFYMACREAFSKKNGKVSIAFTLQAPIDNPNQTLRLSWEYAAPTGWKAIPNLQAVEAVNGPYRFFDPGSVSFYCPPDIEPVNFQGQENYWIRIRILDGDYGKEFVYNFNTNTLEQGLIEPPIITRISISYETPPEPPLALISYNNLQYRIQPGFPFEKMPHNLRSLHLGFDKKLEKGPIGIYFKIKNLDKIETGLTGPTTDLPAIKWHYWSGSDGGQWKPLEAWDYTGNFSESGTIEFFFPRDFTSISQFGKELYWIKAVGFTPGENDDLPSLQGVFINTTYASQWETITGEILGSSDGRSNLAFQVRKTPVISEEIWVDESGPGGESSLDHWVQWQVVEDFLDSSSTSRHCVIHRALGHVLFGDGIHGMIPPMGKDNIKASYRVGGGINGNVPAYEISGMKTSIPFISGVLNPEPAFGGSDTEQKNQLLERGPFFIKHRDKAVTREDFERIPYQVSSLIARSKCILSHNRIIIIIIPYDNSEMPLPSSELLRQVKNYIVKRSLSSVSPSHIAIQKPDYLPVDIAVDIFPVSLENSTLLEKDIIKRIKAFLHPLYGGPEQKGWEFGRALRFSDVYALLESIDGVDHSANLTLNGRAEDVTLNEFQTLCSGSHLITLQFVFDHQETLSRKALTEGVIPGLLKAFD